MAGVFTATSSKTRTLEGGRMTLDTQVLRDRLAGSAEPERLRQAAYRVITRTQDDPAVQIRGVALALAAIADATGLDMRELIRTSERMLHDIDSPFSAQMKALREYAKHEIGRFK